MSITWLLNNIYEIVAFQDYFGGTCLNRYVYSATTVANSAEPADDVMESFVESVIDVVRGIQIPSVNYFKTQIRSISVPSDGLFERVCDLDGTNASPAGAQLPPYICITIRLTGIRGLAGSGFKRYVGVQAPDQTHGILTPSVGGDLEGNLPLAEDALSSPFLTAGGNVFTPTIYSINGWGTPLNHTQFVTQALHNTNLGSQNSRKIGVGQ